MGIARHCSSFRAPRSPGSIWRFGAVALTEVHAAVLDTDRLRELAAQDPVFGQALALAMLRAVAFRVEHMRGRLLDSDRMGGRIG